MTRLRFVELTHDAGTLILTDESGEQHFELPVSAELRKALVRAPRRQWDQPVSLSPKDIQARIRQGATVHEIAIETGLPSERVQAFATPVLAERMYAAEKARRLPVADPTLSRDALRRVFGEDPVSLETMVAYRAEEIGLDPESLNWDAWKRTDALWDLQLTFEVVDPQLLEKEEFAESDFSARWVYHPLRKSVTNANNLARLLSELEPIEQASARLSSVGGEDSSAPEQEQRPSPSTSQQGHEEQLERPVGDLAQHRASKKGLSSDAAAHEKGQDEGATAPEASTPQAEAHENSEAPGASEAKGEEQEEEITARSSARKRSVKDRPTRSRVPSWDQIYFGTKSDKD